MAPDRTLPTRMPSHERTWCDPAGQDLSLLQGVRCSDAPCPALKGLPLLRTPPPLLLNTHCPFWTLPRLSPLQILPRRVTLCWLCAACELWSHCHREECPGMNPALCESIICGCVTRGRLLNLSVPQSKRMVLAGMPLRGFVRIKCINTCKGCRTLPGIARCLVHLGYYYLFYH